MSVVTPQARPSAMDRLLPQMRVAVRMTNARNEGLEPGRHRFDTSFAMVQAYQLDARDECGLTDRLCELRAAHVHRHELPEAVRLGSCAVSGGGLGAGPSTPRVDTGTQHKQGVQR